MIEEEKNYLEFGVKNINLKLSEKLAKSDNEEVPLFGEPYY